MTRGSILFSTVTADGAAGAGAEVGVARAEGGVWVNRKSSVDIVSK